jgi:hypothetical protein
MYRFTVAGLTWKASANCSVVTPPRFHRVTIRSRISIGSGLGMQSLDHGCWLNAKGSRCIAFGRELLLLAPT